MRNLIVTIMCIALVSCTERPVTEYLLYDKVNQVEIVVEHDVGPPLSAHEDKVSIVRDGKRFAIFEGFGGSSVSLVPSREGILVIAYCDGTILETRSFMANPTASGELRAVKVQPVVVDGLRINGREICPQT